MATKSSWSQFLIGLLFICFLLTTIRAVQITENGEEKEQTEAEEKMAKAEKEDPDVFVAHQVKEFVQKLDELNAQNSVEKKHSTWHPTQADYDQLLRTFFQRNVYFLEALGALAKAMVPHRGRYANLAIFDEQFHAKCRNSHKSMKLAMHASKSNQIPAHFDESAKFLEEIDMSDSSTLRTATPDGENQETGKAILQMRTKMNEFLQKFAREAPLARLFMELGKCFVVFATSRQYVPAVSPQDLVWPAHNKLRELSQQLCGLLHDIVYTLLLYSVEQQLHIAIGELSGHKSALREVWRLGENGVPDKFNNVLALVPYAKHEEIVAELKEKLAMPVEWKKAEEETMDKAKKMLYRQEAQIRYYTGLALVTYYKFLQQFPYCYNLIKVGRTKWGVVNAKAGQNKAKPVAVAAHDEQLLDQKNGQLSPTTKLENADGENEEAEMKKEKDDI